MRGIPLENSTIGKMILLLRQGKSNAQIAAELGMPVGTVGARATRLRKAGCLRDGAPSPSGGTAHVRATLGLHAVPVPAGVAGATLHLECDTGAVGWLVQPDGSLVIGAVDLMTMGWLSETIQALVVKATLDEAERR